MLLNEIKNQEILIVFFFIFYLMVWSIIFLKADFVELVGFVTERIGPILLLLEDLIVISTFIINNFVIIDFNNFIR
jgi:hypothetical protein